MKSNNGKTADNRKKKNSRLDDSLSGFWENIFRTAQVPLYIEDASLVCESIKKVQDSGVKDFGNWLDAHPEFVIATIANLKILDVNDRAVEVAGARSKAHLMNSVDRMVVPETLDSFKEILKGMAAGDEIYQGETQYRSLDGRIFHSLNRALLPQGETNEQDILILASHDITNLKLAQNQLQESEGRYRAVVETASDIILIHDLNGKIIFVNKAGRDLMGWTHDELLKLNVRDFVAERAIPEMNQRIIQREKGFSGTFVFEIPMIHPDGWEIPMEISTTMIPGQMREIPQVIAIMRDISDRKAMEARLVNHHKMESLGAMAGGIAHDFNNLLATIMGNAELLKGDRRLGDEFDEFLDSILNASGQAADLCQQMLAYSGKGQFSVNNGDLNMVVHEVSRLLQARVSGRARLNFQLAESLPAVLVDTAPIRQVIMELVTNASESLGDDGGEVMVRTGCAEFTQEALLARHCNPMLDAGSYIYCEVADSGSGMDQGVLGRLFDPFFSTRNPGRGLGLSAALGIIKGHGGGFLIDTIADVGTTVSFLLPKAPVKAKKAGKTKRKKSPDTLHLALAGKLILVVDEDPAVRRVCESFLRRLGCSVLSVGNGPDSIQIFSQRFGEIDLAILDLSMTDMDGVATFRRLRVIRQDLPVIFSTGYGEEELHNRASGLDEYGYISKPFKLANVRQALGLALGTVVE